MSEKEGSNRNSHFAVLQGVLPIKPARIPSEIVAGLTLAALAIPEVMGYTKIAGTPVITGLYTILIPTALFALFGSSRHLVVGADSAAAAILAVGMVGIAATIPRSMWHWPPCSP
jgi:SulP family sulfate permease